MPSAKCSYKMHSLKEGFSEQSNTFEPRCVWHSYSCSRSVAAGSCPAGRWAASQEELSPVIQERERALLNVSRCTRVSQLDRGWSFNCLFSYGGSDTRYVWPGLVFVPVFKDFSYFYIHTFIYLSILFTFFSHMELAPATVYASFSAGVFVSASTEQKWVNSHSIFTRYNGLSTKWGT